MSARLGNSVPLPNASPSPSTLRRAQSWAGQNPYAALKARFLSDTKWLKDKDFLTQACREVQVIYGEGYSYHPLMVALGSFVDEKRKIPEGELIDLIFLKQFTALECQNAVDEIYTILASIAGDLKVVTPALHLSVHLDGRWLTKRAKLKPYFVRLSAICHMLCLFKKAKADFEQLPMPKEVDDRDSDMYEDRSAIHWRRFYKQLPLIFKQLDVLRDVFLCVMEDFQLFKGSLSNDAAALGAKSYEYFVVSLQGDSKLSGDVDFLNKAIGYLVDQYGDVLDFIELRNLLSQNMADDYQLKPLGAGDLVKVMFLKLFSSQAAQESVQAIIQVISAHQGALRKRYPGLALLVAKTTHFDRLAAICQAIPFLKERADALRLKEGIIVQDDVTGADINISDLVEQIDGHVKSLSGYLKTLDYDIGRLA